ncbi:MAG TPA: MBOAT family O-acyltransferase [Vicinamibacterales bacterium]|nr:MBOAT family O-acyltransferase [Vicinamibacterales bacterium]HOQ59394.1 MBOAT family O-acyltransferase [Vicinamibacterales bacterium]HPK72014.1 MBOAT family O-acyltransferase [Vicinamibacterales bacterium]
MIFNSLHFAAFFLVVYAVYRVVPHRGQNWLLLAAGYYFYASWDPRFLGLLIAVTLAAYACGLLLGRTADRGRRKGLLAAGLAFNLTVLGFFKYAGFFAENLQCLLALAGWRADAVTLRVILPVGISFYTFVAMGYLIDVFRRQAEPARNLRDFAVFIGFFPTLLAGPIMRSSGLLRQIASPRSLAPGAAAEGLWLILWGAFKKMFVADNLARAVDGVFAAGHEPSGLAVVLGTVAFAFQIYGDFSGYTDIARGTSRLLGIDLKVNFRFPYFVTTPQGFWANWHITLSEWLRDYLFLPLSYAASRRLDGVRWLGQRDDFWIYASATLVTMLAAGLWHGAAWTYVAWGAYQGLLLVAFRFAARRRTRRTAGPRPWRFQWRDAPAALFMFALTCGGWLLFRAASLQQALQFAGRIVTGFAPSWNDAEAVGLPLAVYAGPLLAVHLAEARRGTLDVVRSWPRVWRFAAVVALVYAIVLFGDFEGSEFLYFQF